MGWFKKAGKSKLFVVFIFSLLSNFVLPFVFAQSSQIAIVKSRSVEPYEKAAQGIQHQLKEEGFDAHFEFYNIEGDIQKGKEISQKIQEKNTALVFTIGTEAFQSVSGHLNQIPLVTAMLVNPEGDEIGSPNQSNLYGAYLKVPYVKHFQLLKKLAPDLSPVTIIYIKSEDQKSIAEAKAAAAQETLTVIPVPIESIQEFSAALDRASRESKALIMILNKELYNSTTAKELLLFSARNKFPIIAFAPNYVKSGALLSFSSDFFENGRSAAKLGASLLRSEPVKEHFIPTEKVWVAWHHGVAETFGIDISGEGKEIIDEYV